MRTGGKPRTLVVGLASEWSALEQRRMPCRAARLVSHHRDENALCEAGARAPLSADTGVNASCCVVTPDVLTTCAELTSARPGHHAMNDRSPTVAWTLLPSERSSLTSVTPGTTCPCTNVYGCPPLVVRWACEASLTGPELGPPSPITDTDGGAEPPAAPPLRVCWADVCWEPPPLWAAFAAVLVKAGPSRHVALALPLCKTMAVNGPRESVTTGCQRPVGIPDGGPPA